MVYKIHDWEDISGDFPEGLLLGNGASMAVDVTKFSYSSLYEEAKERKYIRPEVQKVFEAYGTKDFEAILEALENAITVNSALSIKEKRTKTAYKIVKDALIQTVLSIHPNQGEVLAKLSKGADFLRNFSIVTSLNYDLLLYWTILQANIDKPKIKFKDCFVGPGYSFKYEWEDLEKLIRGETKSILCFYPHGNLAIIKDDFGEDFKIVATKNRLSTIVHKWKTKGFSPLFVSEGTTEQKLSTIRDSTYLNRVYNSVLPNVGSTIAMYGLSFQKNDEHIFKAILKGNIKQVAVSIHKPSNPNWHIRCAEISLMLNKIKPVKITYFDAESKGAWIH